MKHKYTCTSTGCGGSVDLDDEALTQDIVYEKGKGPITEAYRAHDCPIANGLFPPDIDEHPNAKKVA